MVKIQCLDVDSHSVPLLCSNSNPQRGTRKLKFCFAERPSLLKKMFLLLFALYESICVHQPSFYNDLCLDFSILVELSIF